MAHMTRNLGHFKGVFTINSQEPKDCEVNSFRGQLAYQMPKLIVSKQRRQIHGPSIQSQNCVNKS